MNDKEQKGLKRLVLRKTENLYPEERETIINMVTK